MILLSGFRSESVSGRRQQQGSGGGGIGAGGDAVVLGVGVRIVGLLLMEERL